jgi:hypothetical protein
VFALAASALSEARRGGGVRVVATLRLASASAPPSAPPSDGSSVTCSSTWSYVAGVAGCRDLEALAVIAEHLLLRPRLGRNEHGRVRAIHAADPLLVDLLIQRLGEAARARLGG